MGKQVTIPEEFLIANVSETVGELLSALRGNSEVLLDLSAVTRIDCAAIQALLSARKEAQSLGVTLLFARSELIDRVSSALGVSL
jgi:anti-anti-sigma regulatory factor